MAKLLLILGLLWFAFAATHEAMTGRIWFWVLPGMTPPIVFAAVPLILLAAALTIRSYRTMVVGLAVASFAVSIPSTGLNFAALDPRPRADGPADIRIVQMNTDYWGQLRDGTLTDPRDKDRMLAYLRALDADVYLLQEHMLRDGEYAVPVTDLSDVAAVFPEYRAVTAGTLLTLSRLPIIADGAVNPESGSDIYLPPPPYVLRVDVDVGGTRVSTYNVHMPIQIIIEMDWFSRAFYFEIWRRHFIRQDEFAVLVADVEANPNSLVIAGDFNTSPAMGDNRPLLSATRDAARAGRSLYPSTWRVGGQLPRLWRNDWFLVGNRIKVITFESLDPEGNSDHLVQQVSLALPGRQVATAPPGR